MRGCGFGGRKKQPTRALLAAGLCVAVTYSLAGDLPRIGISIDAGKDLGPLKPLFRDFAQGGESPDPDYLEGLIDEMRVLRPRMVRFDHAMHTFFAYETTDGRTAYDFSDFDKKISVIREMGAEPLICLSFTPDHLADGPDRTYPPRDLRKWEELVYVLVRHANLEGDHPIRYWEVWNEPNLEAFWRGTRRQFLDLYTATVRAALRADPAIRIGAAGYAGFPEDWINDLLDHVVANQLRLDFLSWHLYFVPPQTYAQTAQQALEMLRKRGLRAELILDEWNYHAALPPENDTHVGAAYIAEALRHMLDTPLDYAPFFEIRDGWNPQDREFWGRWGMFTWHERPKANYFCMQAWSRLADQRIVLQSTDPRVDGIATRDGDRIVALLYNSTGLAVEAMTAVRCRRDVPHRLSRWLIDEAHSNPALSVSSVSQTAQLERVERATCRPNKGVIERRMLLPAHSVSLVEARPDGRSLDLPFVIGAPATDLVEGRIRQPLAPADLLSATSIRARPDLAGETATVRTERDADEIARTILDYRPTLAVRGAWRFVEIHAEQDGRQAWETLACWVPPQFEVRIPRRIAFFPGQSDPVPLSVTLRNHESEQRSVQISWQTGKNCGKPDVLHTRVSAYEEMAAQLHVPVPQVCAVHSTVCCVEAPPQARWEQAVSVVPAWPVPRKRGEPIQLEAAQYVLATSPPVEATCTVGTMTPSWDNKGLHLKIEVFDEIHEQRHPPEAMWMGDSIQVAFDMGFDGVPGIGYDHNDYEYGAALSGRQEVTWCWAAGLGRSVGQPRDVRARIDRRRNRTVYEIDLPWAALAPLVPQPGAAFGFSLLINDEDGAGRRWCAVGGNIAEQKIPDRFWALVLE